MQRRDRLFHDQSSATEASGYAVQDRGARHGITARLRDKRTKRGIGKFGEFWELLGQSGYTPECARDRRRPTTATQNAATISNGELTHTHTHTAAERRLAHSGEEYVVLNNTARRIRAEMGGDSSRLGTPSYIVS